MIIFNLYILSIAVQYVERAATHIPDKGCGWQASVSGMPDRATYIK